MFIMSDFINSHHINVYYYYTVLMVSKTSNVYKFNKTCAAAAPSNWSGEGSGGVIQKNIN